MDPPFFRAGCRRALLICSRPRKAGGNRVSTRRCLTTSIPESGPIQFRIDTAQSRRSDSVQVAAPLLFNERSDHFRQLSGRRGNDYDSFLNRLRVVPASPSYYTATPTYTDDFLKFSLLVHKYKHLPLGPPNQARPAWRTYEQYLASVNEPVKRGRYERLLALIQRLDSINAPMMPEEVEEALRKFKRTIQPNFNKRKVAVPDKHGRTRGVGQRKSSSAECLIIEGDGEVLVNGKTLTQYFARLHDRESAIWALKATKRADKYNVWVRTSGGGTTGQAEAIQLGVARALLAQEPGLKWTLKKAGVLTRDTRIVERKKPGKLKARKMPAWVKR